MENGFLDQDLDSSVISKYILKEQDFRPVQKKRD
jgi:hypothetical protein